MYLEETEKYLVKTDCLGETMNERSCSVNTSLKPGVDAASTLEEL